MELYKQREQFFTPPTTAKRCYDTFIEVLHKYNDDKKDYTFIEPSAGDGSFLTLMPSKKRIGVDMYPLHNEIQQADYLTWRPTNKSKKYVVVGNPPFKKGELALQFVNHSAEFADYVAFILPPSFLSDEKVGKKNKVKGFQLIHSEFIDPTFYYPNKRKTNHFCVFQVWSKYHTNKKYITQPYDTSLATIYTIDRKNNKQTDKIGLCDVYLSCNGFHKQPISFSKEFRGEKRRYKGIIFHQRKEFFIKQFEKQNWIEKANWSANFTYRITDACIHRTISSLQKKIDLDFSKKTIAHQMKSNMHSNSAVVTIQAVWRGYYSRREAICDCCCKSWNHFYPNEFGVCNCWCDRCGFPLADCRYTCSY